MYPAKQQHIGSLASSHDSTVLHKHLRGSSLSLAQLLCQNAMIKEITSPRSMAANAWPTVSSPGEDKACNAKITPRSFTEFQAAGKHLQPFIDHRYRVDRHSSVNATVVHLSWEPAKMAPPAPGHHLHHPSLPFRSPTPLKQAPMFLPGPGNIYKLGSSSSSMASLGLSQQSWKIKPPREKLSVPAEVGCFKAGSSCTAGGSSSLRAGRIVGLSTSSWAGEAPGSLGIVLHLEGPTLF